MGTLALIPARGGSKRLPRKNILPFAGRPMIGWTIEAARTSGVFDRVMVTTDDPQIAEVATDWGAEVLLRPAEVSDDKAGLIDVLHHAARHVSNWPEQICLPLGNCPLRTAQDLAESHAVFTRTAPPALLSVVEFGWTPPFRTLTSGPQGLEFLFADWMTKKSQEYPPVVCPSGAIYWARRDALKDSTSLYLPGIQGFPIPWERGIDIDTAEDFRLAEGLKFAMDHGFDFRRTLP